VKGAFLPTDRQADGIRICIRACEDLTGAELTGKDVNELTDLALPMVWEGWGSKYIVARMMLHLGSPGLWGRVREEVH